MFDIGFFELMLIAVVALLVIGPERLPETLRTLGLWIGRIKRGLRETRAEIEQHLGADDIRRQLHNEEVMRSLKETRDQLNRSINPDRLRNQLQEQLTGRSDDGSQDETQPSPPQQAQQYSQPQAQTPRQSSSQTSASASSSLLARAQTAPGPVAGEPADKPQSANDN